MVAAQTLHKATCLPQPDGSGLTPASTHLDTRFDAGLSFLRAWQRWRGQPSARQWLHYVGLAAQAPTAAQILSGASQDAALSPLAQELSTACWGLLPGVHRISLEDGNVLLTLAIGEAWSQLRALPFLADFLELKQPGVPAEWTYAAIELIAKRCRRSARVTVEEPSPALDALLRRVGFVHEATHGNASFAQARYEPHWRLPGDTAPPSPAPGHAVVVGAGLSGAAVANSLARRGWRVTVLDAAAQPAQGASSLPVGLLVPHVSPDDALISRATRAGVRMTLDTARRRLKQGQDWQMTGTLFSQHSRARRLPASWLVPGNEAARPWAQERPDGIWHEQAAWIKPQALVRAWLAHPGITFTGNSAVAQVEQRNADWAVLDAAGQTLAQAPLVVLCTAYATRALLPGTTLGAMDCVAGQVVTGAWQPEWASSTPVSGEGHFIPAVPGPRADPDASPAPFWLSGSTYERAPLTDLDAAHAIRSTADRMAPLSARLPALVATALQGQLQSGQVTTWRGERCTTSDRLPTVGPVTWQGAAAGPGLQVCIGMGSRGLTFAALCAELLAAQWHGEPWPVERRMAQALGSARWQNRRTSPLTPSPPPDTPT